MTTERRQFIDLFASCLADSGTRKDAVAVCSARVGRSAAWGRQALDEISRGLGRQAS